MFYSEKVPIFWAIVLLLCACGGEAVGKIDALKRIEQKFTEFKVKHDDMQRRVMEMLSLHHREYQGEACYNSTIGTFGSNTDIDQYGNVILGKIEVELANLIDFSEKQEVCDCEKANEITNKDFVSFEAKLANRLTDELKTQFVAYKDTIEETIAKGNTNFPDNANWKKLLDSLFENFGEPNSSLSDLHKGLERQLTKNLQDLFEVQSNKTMPFILAAANDYRTLLESFERNQNISEQIRNKLDEYTDKFAESHAQQKMCLKQLETEFDKQKETNNVNHRTLLETLKKNQNISEQIQIQLDHHIETFAASQDEKKKFIKLGLPNSCEDVILNGNGAGEYVINIANISSTVYCDNRGKMLIQQQMLGDVKFFERNWSSYKKGFGDPKKQYWFGLEKLYQLLSSRRYDLHIIVVDFENVTTEYIYDDFKIGDESENYKLKKLGNFTGNETGKRLYLNVNNEFGTFDRDKEKCAYNFGSGWWYNICYYINLNVKVEMNRAKETTLTLHWNTIALKGASMFIKQHGQGAGLNFIASSIHP